MAESNKPQKWWQTLTGVLTAATAIVTAITGLLVALHQTGIFDVLTIFRTTDRETISAPYEASPPSIVSEVPGNGNGIGNTQGAAVTSSRATSPTFQAPLNLAAGHEVRLGNVQYKILSLKLEAYNTENHSLRLTVLMTNNDRFGHNFWDSSFRLLTEGLIKAPVSNLNKVVHGNSTETGDVEFIIPAATGSATLRIINFGESTDVPLDLTAAI
jgi:hypothetical protein